MNFVLSIERTIQHKNKQILPYNVEYLFAIVYLRMDHHFKNNTIQEMFQISKIESWKSNSQIGCVGCGLRLLGLPPVSLGVRYTANPCFALGNFCAVPVPFLDWIWRVDFVDRCFPLRGFVWQNLQRS